MGIISPSFVFLPISLQVNWSYLEERTKDIKTIVILGFILKFSANRGVKCHPTVWSSDVIAVMSSSQPFLSACSWQAHM